MEGLVTWLNDFFNVQWSTGAWVLIVVVVAFLVFGTILELRGRKGSEDDPGTATADDEDDDEGDDGDDDLSEGDLDFSSVKKAPICPHCKAKMLGIHYISSDNDVVYSANCCGVLLSVIPDP